MTATCLFLGWRFSLLRFIRTGATNNCTEQALSDGGEIPPPEIPSSATPDAAPARIQHVPTVRVVVCMRDGSSVTFFPPERKLVDERRFEAEDHRGRSFQRRFKSGATLPVVHQRRLAMTHGKRAGRLVAPPPSCARHRHRCPLSRGCGAGRRVSSFLKVSCAVPQCLWSSCPWRSRTARLIGKPRRESFGVPAGIRRGENRSGCASAAVAPSRERWIVGVRQSAWMRFSATFPRESGAARRPDRGMSDCAVTGPNLLHTAEGDGRRDLLASSFVDAVGSVDSA